MYVTLCACSGCSWGRLLVLALPSSFTFASRGATYHENKSKHGEERPELQNTGSGLGLKQGREQLGHPQSREPGVFLQELVTHGGARICHYDRQQELG